ncbi:MAG: dockerin type I domain-containing protein [Planctomycetota bacterium]
MTSIRHLFRWTPLAALLGSALLTAPAFAVPYASQVRNTSGSTWEYVINQDADEVVITRDGGNAITLNNVTAGRYTFDMAGFTGFDIQVTNSAASGMQLVSDETNLFTKFFRPNGLAVNQDPNSPYFGTIYVANGIQATTGGANARDNGDGIYALRPDLQGVDFSTPAWAVPDANDITQAKLGAGWEVGDQAEGSGNNSVFRIALDDGGNVIVGDWSDANGGIKYIGPDLTGGGLVLDFQGGLSYGEIDPAGPFDGSGSPFIHGSIRGVPNVTGTVGTDLVVTALDEDLNRNPVGLFDGTYPNNTLPDTDNDGFPTDGNHIWRWNVGSETDSRVKPELVIDVGSDSSLGQLGADSCGGGTCDRPLMLDLNIGVRADAEFFPQIGDSGLWILTTPRFDGDESGIVIVDVDETGAEDPEVLWSSRQFTIDNNLDAFPGDTGTFFGINGVENPHSDVFRNTGSVEVSPDGQFLYVHRWLTDNPDAVDGEGNPIPDINPYLGQDSEYPGVILKIPLDESGLPVILIDDNGTPGDTSDDFFTNLEDAETTAQLAFNNQHEIEVDAAGNIYITDNASELLEVFTPGGDSVTTFSFDGVTASFTVGDDVVAPFPGDANGDGTVDLLDLDILGSNFGTPSGATFADGDFNGDGTVDLLDLDILGGNFGNSAPAFAVPEPTSLVIVLSAAAGIATRRRRS